MSPFELVIALSVIANAVLTGFIVADVRRLLVQHHAEIVARRTEEARRLDQERRRDELRDERARAKAAQDERETAEREVRRRRQLARDDQRRKTAADDKAARRRARAAEEAERYQRLESILLVMAAHLRHMVPDVTSDTPLPPPSQPRMTAEKATLRPGAPRDEPDSERSRPTADLGVVSSSDPARGPSRAMLPPPPSPPRAPAPAAASSDDAALRAAGLQKRAAVAESTRPPPHKPPVSMQRTRTDTRPSVPSPLVRDRGAVVPVVEVASQERPSCDELTTVSDRGMDLRLQVAEAGPLVPMRFGARAAPPTPGRKPEAG